jgi:hypothetical protein
VTDTRYAPFGISRSGGEMFYLIASNNAIVDQVTTIGSDMDQAMIRSERGEWELSDRMSPGSDDAGDVRDIYNENISSVRITEVSAAGSAYYAPEGVFCDWVELYNSSKESVDISGYILTDNIGNDKFAFPEGTVIAPESYVIVYCNSEITDPNVAPFRISGLGGETVILKDSNRLIVERVEILPMEVGSQILSGDGAWVLTQMPSPGYENTDAGYNAFLHSIGAEVGVVRISEVMADSAICPDGSGEFSDWIELVNTDSQTVNLEGWYLSDDPANLQKWTFPHFELQPGERRILYCSGKGVAADGEVHAGFSLASSGEDLILSTYLGLITDQVTFGKSETNQSYIFDNGASLSDTPTPGYANDQAGYEAYWNANVPGDSLLIWEVMTSNDSYLPQSLGKCYDWVELMNASNEEIQLSQYSLTEDGDVPGMYRLPEKVLAPGETVVIILSGDESLSTKRYDHAGFTLNAAEDQLLLYRNDSLVDYVYLKNIPVGMSYGRQAGNGGFYYMEPSPENPNFAGYRLISSEPHASYAPGVYSSEDGVQVTLDADGVIYYTTDGSTPTETSAQYNGPISLDATSTLRAVAVEPGKLPSEVYTATFVIGQTHDLPVLSLVVEPDALWGADGVYKDWDLDVKEVRLGVNLAYAGADGAFSLDCEMSMHGEISLQKAKKKSFTVRFKDAYDGPLYYDVFEDGEVTGFSSLLVRSSMESTYSTHMHDAFIAAVAAEGCDTVLSQKNKYVALYLNGEYWGLYSLREHHSTDHYASYMGVPSDTVTMVRYANDDPGLNKLYNFMKNNSLSSDENYAYVASQMDMTSFADWLILQSYMSNIDINNNMRYYYSTVDGLWRCGLVDLDLGMCGSFTAFDEIATAWHHGEFVRSLLENQQFRDLVVERMIYLLSGPLSDENAVNWVKSNAERIEGEVLLEQERWGTPVSGWDRFVRDMINFCDGRTEQMIDSFCSVAGYKKNQKQEVFASLLN